jgi:RNA polymerase sigma factor (sigma-70 family)
LEFLTRETLLQKIKSQDSQEYWNDFITIYTPYIKAIIRKISVGNSENDDLVQAVFLVCLNKLPEFEYDSEKGRFRYWLSRITTWVCNNHIRKSNNRQKILYDNQSFFEQDLPSEIEIIADQEWKVFISNKAWENVKSELSDTLLKIYEKYLSGANYQQISQEMNMPENTVIIYKGRVEKKIIAEIERLKIALG